MAQRRPGQGLDRRWAQYSAQAHAPGSEWGPPDPWWANTGTLVDERTEEDAPQWFGSRRNQTVYSSWVPTPLRYLLRRGTQGPKQGSGATGSRSGGEGVPSGATHVSAGVGGVGTGRSRCWGVTHFEGGLWGGARSVKADAWGRVPSECVGGRVHVVGQASKGQATRRRKCRFGFGGTERRSPTGHVACWRRAGPRPHEDGPQGPQSRAEAETEGRGSEGQTPVDTRGRNAQRGASAAARQMDPKGHSLRKGRKCTTKGPDRRGLQGMEGWVPGRSVHRNPTYPTWIGGWGDRGVCGAGSGESGGLWG